jgi:hypothetical protein
VFGDGRGHACFEVAAARSSVMKHGLSPAKSPERRRSHLAFEGIAKSHAIAQGAHAVQQEIAIGLEFQRARSRSTPSTRRSGSAGDAPDAERRDLASGFAFTLLAGFVLPSASRAR